jgi:outer membrane receptor protein involved in Fe transport
VRSIYRFHVRAVVLRVLFSVLFIALLSTGGSVAQTASSVLRGVVRDGNGNPAIAAIVQARSEKNGAVRTAITDDDGRYQMAALPLGVWTVVARAVDGSVSETVRVQLRLQDAARQDLVVGGGVTERVEVRATGLLIDSKETSGKLSVSAEQVDDLPIAGRNFLDLSMLDSSVRPAAEGSFYGETGSVFVVNGATGRSNSFLVDGLDNNDLTSGTSISSAYSQQVIDEFVLLTHQFSPEFGKARGGVLNIVTKQGGNEPRFEAFGQGFLHSWGESGGFVDSLPTSGLSRDRDRSYTGGFNASGPFKKDRAFFFFAYEKNSADRLQPYTGVDRNGSVGGRFLAPFESDNFFLRTDFNLNQNNQLMVRLLFDDRSANGVNVGGLYTPEAGFFVDEQDLALAATLTTIVSDRLVAESRLLISDSTFDQFANSDLSGVTRPSGIFGGNPLNRQARDESKLQFVENLTWSLGRHTVKAGFDVTVSSTKLDAEFNPNGGFIYEEDFPFEPGDCGDINISDIILARTNGSYPNIPCAGTPGVDDDGDGQIDEDAIVTSFPLVVSYVFGQPSNTFDDTQYALFLQDHWQPNERWFFEYGLRYDVSSYKLPESARIQSTIPNGGAGVDDDNISPRFGFTWKPSKDSRTLIRGGGGMFYDKLVLAFPAVTAVTSGTQIGLFFPRGFAVELDENFIETQGIDNVLPSLLFLPQLVLSFSTGTELDVPYSVQWNLGIDTPTSQRSVFRANVTRSQGYHLTTLKDLNPVIGLYLPGPGSCPGNLDPTIEEGIPCHGNDPNVGSIAAIVSEGRSWYTGVDLGWRYFGDESWLDLSYTWSKSEDTQFDPLKGGISLPPNSDGFVRSERGLAGGDRRHRLVLSGDLPVGAGFRAAGVFSWSSPIPFNVTTGRDDNNDGILTDRPLGVRRNAGQDSSIQGINDYRNSIGLSPITRLSAPSFSQFDLNLYRPFTMREGRLDGRFYMQIFNLFDSVNLGLVDGRITSTNFGRGITLAGPPRTVLTGFQFGF